MRLIDADEAIRRIEENMRAYYEESSGGYYLAEAAVDEIDSMPPVDAVPVVRCKDCSNHGKCMFEDVFLLAGKSDGYCCVGGRNEYIVCQ